MFKHNLKHCINCGIKGHTIKLCNSPTISYGLMCYKLVNNEPLYVMIQRKNSISFIEFIRGKYELSNADYIFQLIEHCCDEERDMLKTKNMNELWHFLWGNKISNRLQSEFENSLEKFNKLKKGYIFQKQNGNREHICLLKCIQMAQNSENKLIEPEWEFPKGRRNLNESDIQCAIREFIEEANIPLKYLNVCNFTNKSYEETYISVNKTRYRNVYYICKYVGPQEYIPYNSKNKVQIKEVRDVKWKTYDEVLRSINKKYKQRIELFKRIHKIITSSSNK